MMNKIPLSALLLLLAINSPGALAKQQTVTLEVPTMNCATCPFTVKKSLQQVEGVTTADVSFETRLAIVTFDDQQTSVEALTDATTNAGYPSTPLKR